MQGLRRTIEEPHPLDEHVVWFVIVSYLCFDSVSHILVILIDWRPRTRIQNNVKYRATCKKYESIGTCLSYLEQQRKQTESTDKTNSKK